jgi:hypothetical protein
MSLMPSIDLAGKEVCHEAAEQEDMSQSTFTLASLFLLPFVSLFIFQRVLNFQPSNLLGTACRVLARALDDPDHQNLESLSKPTRHSNHPIFKKLSHIAEQQALPSIEHTPYLG